MSGKFSFENMITLRPDGRLERVDENGHIVEITELKTYEPKKNRGGRPGLADWDALHEEFLRRVREMGIPDRLNEKGWRTQADVVRWVDNLLMKRERIEDMKENTIKYHVRKWISSAENS